MATLEFNLENVHDKKDARDIFRITDSILMLGELDIGRISMNYDPKTKKASYAFGVDINEKELNELNEFIRDIFSIALRYKGTQISWKYNK